VKRASNNLIVWTGHGTHGGELSLITAQGRLLVRKQVADAQMRSIPLHGLSPGVYLLGMGALNRQVLIEP
jgi:hypothetical protein